MRRYISIVMTLVMGFCFMGSVSALETDLNSIASIAAIIGGEEKEIIQTDSSNNYKFYYKYVPIDSEDFNTYIGAKYIVDKASDSSDEYVTAAEQISEYEEIFYGLIPEVTAADLESWTLATDGEITLSDLIYKDGEHNGYVLAVAAVKDGDTNVYISRLILESSSATTLQNISYNANDDASYGGMVTGSGSDVSTSSNPNTGISDYAIYLVPVCIILGSGILLRKSFA